MIFVHWDTLGNLNTITAQIKEVMALNQNLSLQQSQATSNKTSSSSSADNPISAIGKQIGSAIGLGGNGSGGK